MNRTRQLTALAFTVLAIVTCDSMPDTSNDHGSREVLDVIEEMGVASPSHVILMMEPDKDPYATPQSEIQTPELPSEDVETEVPERSDPNRTGGRSDANP